jgi:hypothetical protein
MPLIKDVKLPASTAQKRVQAAAWVCIYGGLLTLLTGVTMGRSQSAGGWHTGHTLMLSGSLATALGAALIYIRSRMK